MLRTSSGGNVEPIDQSGSPARDRARALASNSVVHRANDRTSRMVFPSAGRATSQTDSRKAMRGSGGHDVEIVCGPDATSSVCGEGAEDAVEVAAGELGSEARGRASE
ncbi:hypothetical protein GCM10027167_73360 [Nocardia heshunensis]